MERRKANLERKIQEMEEEIERRKKARQGLESLSKAYVETPDFCDEQGQNDVVRQLAEVCCGMGGSGRVEFWEGGVHTISCAHRLMPC